ncbi:uncharacterized protein LOC144134770 isoform X2 [Amblyomma americanum]
MLWCPFIAYLSLTHEAFAYDPGPKYAKPEEIFTYQDPTEILGSDAVLYLYRASNSWNPIATLCMKSSFVAAIENVSIRSIDYFKQALTKPGSGMQQIIMKFNMTANITSNMQPSIHIEPASGDEALPQGKTAQMPVTGFPSVAQKISLYYMLMGTAF